MELKWTWDDGCLNSVKYLDVRPQTADLEACRNHRLAAKRLMFYLQLLRFEALNILWPNQVNGFTDITAWMWRDFSVISPGQDTMHQIQMNFFRQSEFLLLFLFVIMLSLSFIISVVGNVYIYVWQPNISYFLNICLFFLFHAWFSFFKPNLFLNFLFFTFLNMMTWNPS